MLKLSREEKLRKKRYHEERVERWKARAAERAPFELEKVRQKEAAVLEEVRKEFGSMHDDEERYVEARFGILSRAPEFLKNYFREVVRQYHSNHPVDDEANEFRERILEPKPRVMDFTEYLTAAFMGLL